MTWVDLDLHKRYITVCALDDAGMILAEHRRLPADDTALLAWLGNLPAPVTVAMEATVYWAWLHDRLTAAGYAAVVAHPRQVLGRVVLVSWTWQEDDIRLISARKASPGERRQYEEGTDDA